MTGSQRDTEEPSTGTSPSVKLMLLISFGFSLAQQALTTYSDPGLGPHLLWLSVTAILLWLVHGSRSNGARLILVVAALLGAVVYLVVPGDERSILLSLLYLAQAVPLLTQPVRRHVSGRRDVETA